MPLQADKRPIAMPRSNLSKSDSSDSSTSDSVKPLLPNDSFPAVLRKEQDKMKPPVPKAAMKPKLGVSAIAPSGDLKSEATDDSIYEPTLVKPSQVKNKQLLAHMTSGEGGKPNGSDKPKPPVAKKPETPPVSKKPTGHIKPSVQTKPTMGGKIPPPPPSKDKKRKPERESSGEDAYEKVNVSTNR